MTTIEEFIEARLAEDERLAQDASEQPGPVWDHALYEDYPGIYSSQIVCEDELFAHVDYEPPAEHIARHDPARVLRQCAALREVLGFGAALTSASQQIDFENTVLLRIAAIWSDHPEYQQEWSA